MTTIETTISIRPIVVTSQTFTDGVAMFETATQHRAWGIFVSGPDMNVAGTAPNRQAAIDAATEPRHAAGVEGPPHCAGGRGDGARGDAAMISVHVAKLVQRVLRTDQFTVTAPDNATRFVVIEGDWRHRATPIGDFDCFEHAMLVAEVEARKRGCEAVDCTLDEAGA
ncbi:MULTISPECIES: hypothetical protein [unclassified Rhizobium]|uniref:hypothetical protein n=2 Tax=unclassified Rhizobium TaxID=2613769 RepID=UPI0027D4137A|nr:MULTISPECIES: hypothetical protein [unclassified Rhizobium]MDQ4407027.1 hypothetical protein [Rhizobium sp. AN63]